MAVARKPRAVMTFKIEMDTGVVVQGIMEVDQWILTSEVSPDEIDLYDVFPQTPAWVAMRGKLLESSTTFVPQRKKRSKREPRASIH